MTTKGIRTDAHTIAFDCPQCRLRTKVALDKVGHTYHCRAQCSCGNTFLAEIEFREKTRKLLDLPGAYEVFPLNTATCEAGTPIAWSTTEVSGPCNCRVIDISPIGLAFLKSDERPLAPGDIVRLSFLLDDVTATEIVLECEVRHVKGNFVGCRLRAANSALEYYLLG